MTAPQRPASNSDARKRAEERAAEKDACTHSSTTGTLAEQDDGSWVEEDVRCIFCGRVVPPGSAAS